MAATGIDTFVFQSKIEEFIEKKLKNKHFWEEVFGQEVHEFKSGDTFAEGKIRPYRIVVKVVDIFPKNRRALRIPWRTWKRPWKPKCGRKCMESKAYFFHHVRRFYYRKVFTNEKDVAQNLAIALHLTF